MKINVHHFHHCDSEVIKLLKEILNKVPSIDDVKAAVAAAATQVTDTIQAAVTKETAEVVAQIQAIPVGQPITQADLDAIVASVNGIGTAASVAVDSISVNDLPIPPPPPTP